jgi:putative endonuclease
MYYVYLLKSERDEKFYIGCTDSIERRLSEHNSGRTKSTKNRRPFLLVGYKEFEDKGKARFFEYNVKRNANLRYKFINEVQAK